MNPFQPFYRKCNTGDPRDKLDKLAAFPIMVDLEPTSTCNFRCLMCPTGNRSVHRRPGFMTDETYKAILGECALHKTAIRFIGWGEPLLHPRIVKFVDAAGKADLLTHINTNASKLTPDFARKLVEAGLSSIKFSFQGTDQKTYAEMRGTDFFDGMLTRIRMMREARGNSRAPFIAASTSTTDETVAQIAEFRALLEPLVDQLSIGATTFDFLDEDSLFLSPAQWAAFERQKSVASPEKRHPDPCPEVYDKLTVHWDGEVRVCCNDYDGTTNLGNVNEKHLSEIWQHPVMVAYRDRLADKEYSGPLCSVCFDYMSLSA